VGLVICGEVIVGVLGPSLEVPTVEPVLTVLLRIVSLSAVEFGVLGAINRFAVFGLSVEGLYVWFGLIGLLRNLRLWCKILFLMNRFLAVELLLLLIGPSIVSKRSCNKYYPVMQKMVYNVMSKLFN
jgi:hypothetical protein